MCGLYETARELIAAECELGHDAWAVDPVDNSKFGALDRGVQLRSSAAGADVVIDHSGITTEIRAVGAPVIHMRHGRPRSTYLLDATDTIKGVYSHIRRVGQSEGYAEIVTFWPQHVSHWELLCGRKVHCIPAPVDLKAWTPDGPTGYRFGGHRGACNVIIADAWRTDIDPFEAICEIAEIPNVTLHLYALPTNAATDTLVEALRARGVLGEAKPRVQGLANVYRAADAAIVPHNIDTRSVREAMACGCPVVRYPGRGWALESRIADCKRRRLELKQRMREEAEARFNPRSSAQALLEIIQRCEVTA